MPGLVIRLDGAKNLKKERNRFSRVGRTFGQNIA
jgi:hypothetical protein